MRTSFRSCWKVRIHHLQIHAHLVAELIHLLLGAENHMPLPALSAAPGSGVVRSNTFEDALTV